MESGGCGVGSLMSGGCGSEGPPACFVKEMKKKKEES